VNDVLEDPRLIESDAAAFDAERLEREGDLPAARALYATASARTASVALELTSLPKTRSILAVSAVCLAARAGRYDRAVDLAERFLAEPGALSRDGIAELQDLLANYRTTLLRGRVPMATPSSRIRRTRPMGRQRARSAS